MICQMVEIVVTQFVSVGHGHGSATVRRHLITLVLLRFLVRSKSISQSLGDNGIRYTKLKSEKKKNNIKEGSSWWWKKNELPFCPRGILKLL